MVIINEIIIHGGRMRLYSDITGRKEFWFINKLFFNNKILSLFFIIISFLWYGGIIQDSRVRGFYDLMGKDQYL